MTYHEEGSVSQDFFLSSIYIKRWRYDKFCFINPTNRNSWLCYTQSHSLWSICDLFHCYTCCYSRLDFNGHSSLMSVSTYKHYQLYICVRLAGHKGLKIDASGPGVPAEFYGLLMKATLFQQPFHSLDQFVVFWVLLCYRFTQLSMNIITFCCTAGIIWVEMFFFLVGLNFPIWFFPSRLCHVGLCIFLI